MPILVQEHSTLRLHRIVLHGRVVFGELYNLLALHKLNRDWAMADTFHIVAEDADLSDLTPASLDVLRAEYRALQQSLDFHLVRRALWVCTTPEAWAMAEFWLKDRHWRDGQGSELLLVARLEDGADLFGADEIEAGQRDQGWVTLARIDQGAGGPAP